MMVFFLLTRQRIFLLLPVHFPRTAIQLKVATLNIFLALLTVIYLNIVMILQKKKGR